MLILFRICSQFSSKQKSIIQQINTQWGYGELNGPREWKNMYPHLNKCKRQSPINIMTAGTVYSELLQGIKVYWNNAIIDKVTNVGTGVEFMSNKVPWISGGLLESTYEFDHFHIHWSGDNQVGSEHALDGNFYPAEVHFVFYNTTLFISKEAALDMDFRGIVILCSFLELGGDKQCDFTLLSDAVKNANYKGKSHLITSGLPVNALIPENNRQFYAYNGSLTVPPCSECCIWLIYREPLKIYAPSLDVFRNLHSTTKVNSNEDTVLLCNCRPLQAINNRIIYRSFDRY
ncbi:hypothetical protein GJ496_004185 [Pomphorhynchus laevis]|nr:hypothetical protein GJ496_004185 [Pomphorhynchus laevis]